MSFFLEYGLFLAKTLTIVGAILIVTAGIVAASMRRQKSAGQQHLEITHLNKQYEEMEQALYGALLSPHELKQKHKAQKKIDKAQNKADKKATKIKAKEKRAADKQPKKLTDAEKSTNAEKTTDAQMIADDGHSSVTQVESKEQRKPPKPGSQKEKVYIAGIAEGGALISKVAEQMKCKPKNVRQHITQLHKDEYGFGYQIDEGKYKIIGAPTHTWDGKEITPPAHDHVHDHANPQPATKCIFVLDFDGDIRASAVTSLRQEISAILTLARSEDEVVVRLESGGGVVHGYGLAASQLQRIRAHNIPLTVAVDKVAASGGYMMACVADKIIAAPFAIIGSIGVLAQLPNLHRLLKKHEIDFEQLYAGEYKRTLTMFGENTDKAREKMQQELQETHDLFKAHVKDQRPQLNIGKVATGEHWFGSRALELGLVDHLQTSDDYLMAARFDTRLILLNYTAKKTLLNQLADLPGIRSLRGLHNLRDLQHANPADGLDKPLLL